MRSKIEYLKENWVISLLWNIPMTLLLSVPLSYVIEDVIILCISIFCVLVVLHTLSIEKWYAEEKFNCLERRIKELEDKNSK